MTEEKTIWWNDENSSVMLIDQTLLPTEYKVIEITEVSRFADAIRRLEVRGAPALGIAGAFGVALSAARCVSDAEFDETIASDAALLKSTRPTAVNLAWGVDKVLRSMENLPPEMARIMALFAAKNIAENDTKACMFLGHNGASLLPQIGTVLTHCNAGALACSSWGTALGVIRSAKKMGKKISVVSCETRPLLQGSRLTAWELARDEIPVTTIVDSEAAFLMRQGKIGRRHRRRRPDHERCRLQQDRDLHACRLRKTSRHPVLRCCANLDLRRRSLRSRHNDRTA